MVYFMEDPIKMDDLGVPLFLETPIYASWTHESASSQYSHHLKIVGGMKHMDFFPTFPTPSVKWSRLSMPIFISRVSSDFGTLAYY